MPNTEKLEMLKSVRKYILSHPKTNYADLTAALKIPQLTTIQFYNIKAQLRKKGQLVDPGGFKTAGYDDTSASKPKTKSNSMHVEILESVDVANFSDDIKGHYKSNILGLLQRHVPDGKNLRMVFLSDPPVLEIQRIVT